MSSFIDALDAEIAAKQAEVDAFPPYRQLQKLKATRAEYAGRAARADHSWSNAQTRARAPATRSRMLARAAEIVGPRIEPLRTADIFDALVAEGFSIGGKDPRSNLSAMLSNSDDFESHGRKGWTLAWSAPRKPRGEIAADANPTQEPSAALFEPRLISEGIPLRGQGEPQQGPGGSG
jgi:hypothetical protein